jgi:hypothetical protein
MLKHMLWFGRDYIKVDIRDVAIWENELTTH